jgi:ADP-ribose pyrophosphatase YjhB (NUDIX family)
MYCTYKIYYNDSFVVLTCKPSQLDDKFARIYDTKKGIEDFLTNISFLFDGQTNDKILLVDDKPGEVMCHLLDMVDIVVAGGGIVANDNGELLLIFRRGKWDMPKGKIEIKECIKDGAMREVEEETGVKVEITDEKPITTYHAYKLKGKNCIKETSWFKMKALNGAEKLAPQTEEDIEQALWVKPDDLMKYRDISYPLIWGLLSWFVPNQSQVL